jgi:hypothetical protein
MNRKTYLLVLVTLLFSSAFAQDKTFYLFDANDKPVTERGIAATFEVVSKQNDTVFVARYYQNYGSMIWQQTFKDAALTIPNGRFAWYDGHGFLDSTGFIQNGVKHGKWEYFDSTAKKEMMNNIKTDSKEIEIDDFSPSGFPPKMQKSWMHYLKNNLDIKTGQNNSVYAVSAGNKAVEIVSFTIKPDKTIDDVYFLHSEAYPYDEEVLRVIKNADAWLAAQKEPITTPLKEIQRIIFPYQYK